MQKAGKYEIVRKIGAGGFGVVYEGRDPFIKRRVAIKACTTEDEEIRQRFYREAEIAGNLQHKNIVTIHDFGIEDGVPYLVQEYLTGEDLEHAIARAEPIPLERKLDILIQAAHGLRHAHEAGVIHRDIKPANVRLLDDGRVKILDFGIAKLAHVESRLTKEGMTVGTAAYLPPEQIRAEKIDFRADVFSFGVLAYELLAMVRPFDGKTLSTLLFQILSQTPRPLAEAMPGLPPRLTSLVDRCLDKEVDRRCASFAEVADELEAVYGDLTAVSRIEAVSPTVALPRAAIAPEPEPDPAAERERERLAREQEEQARREARVRELLTAAAADLAAGHPERAADLARQAMALDPGAAEARKLVDEAEAAQRLAAERERLRRESEELARAEAERARRHAALAAEIDQALAGDALARAEKAIVRGERELGPGTFEDRRRQLEARRVALQEAERLEAERRRVEREEAARRAAEEAERRRAEEKAAAERRAAEARAAAERREQERRAAAEAARQQAIEQAGAKLHKRLAAGDLERARRELAKAVAAHGAEPFAAVADQLERAVAEQAAERERAEREASDRRRAAALEVSTGSAVPSGSFASPGASMTPRSRAMAGLAAGVGIVGLATVSWLYLGRGADSAGQPATAPPGAEVEQELPLPSANGPAVETTLPNAAEARPEPVEPATEERPPVPQPEPLPAERQPPVDEPAQRPPAPRDPAPIRDAPARAAEAPSSTAPPVSEPVRQAPTEPERESPPVPVSEPAVETRPEAPAVDETAAVRAALERYRAAYQALDAAAVRAAWPGLDAGAERQIARAFEGYQSLAMTLSDCRYAVDGDRATATCRVTQRIDVRVGRDFESTQEAVFQLRRAGDRWVITERTAS